MSTPGKVYLVGAGPGDPGLLTLKGQECLRRADLILYDGLVNPLLLRNTSATASRTCRSPGPDGRILQQNEINERLIAAAREGLTVVRLKGGDPFIFGRGSEEAAALVRAGIPFEVVPGITAAVAASECAGISLTHRDIASAVAFITGHEDPQKQETSIDYAVLSRFPGTLVFYMGLHRLESIANSLIQHGKSPATPAAVISRATTPAQVTVTAPLCELSAKVSEAHLHAPSLIVIGECVNMRDEIAWFENRPLFGKRVGITRPSQQADPVISQLLELGAQPILLPVIEILPVDDWAPVDDALSRLDEYDWLVFTSSNGVTAFLDRLWDTGGDMRRLSNVRLAAIGNSTAQTLADYHLKPDIVPEMFRAEELAAALKPHVVDKRVLWARASRGRDILPKELRSVGAVVDELVVYRNVDIDGFSEDSLAIIENGQIDWIGLSSPSIARGLRNLLSPVAFSEIGRTVRLASISPVTTAAAREVGLQIDAEATTYTWDGICSAIVAAEELAERPGNAG